MLINKANIACLFKGFNTSFNKGLGGAPTYNKDIAMQVPSSASETNYAWLGQFPRLHEWIGDRIVQNLAAHSFAVKNKRFESTISVPRTDIEDDQYGVYGPLMEELGKTVGEHPDELLFTLLNAGFATTCYDGQYFFDNDHPVKKADGTLGTVSNVQAGAGSPWFLLDTSRAIKPLLFQTRIPYIFSTLDKETDEVVFMRDKYIYGVRARVNAGFGLWQLAYGSKAALDVMSYAAARGAMTAQVGDAGRPLGVVPDTLVVHPSLEKAGREVVSASLNADGGSNVWAGSAKLIVAPWLAAQ